MDRRDLLRFHYSHIEYDKEGLTMKDHTPESIKACTIQGLRELYRRVEEEDDRISRFSLYWLEGYFRAMMRHLDERDKRGK